MALSFGAKMIIIFAFLFIVGCGATSEPKLARLDVIIPPASDQFTDVSHVKALWYHQLDKFLKAYPSIRLAIVTMEPGESHQILSTFTNDSDVVKAAFGRWVPKATTSQDHAGVFRTAREILFDFSNLERANILILFMTNVASNFTNANMEAKKLREKCAFIYVVYAFDSRSSNDSRAYANSTSRTFNQKMTEMFKGTSIERPLHAIISQATADICTICHFGNRTNCLPAKRPASSTSDYFGDKNSQCKLIKIDKGFYCPLAKCVEECDRAWPWEDIPDCKFVCGVIRRYSVDKPPANMEHCQREINCGQCTSPATKPQIQLATRNDTNTSSLDYSEDLIPLIIVAAIVAFVDVIVLLAIFLFPWWAARSTKMKSLKNNETLVTFRKADNSRHAHEGIFLCQYPGRQCPKIYLKFRYNPNFFAAPPTDIGPSDIDTADPRQGTSTDSYYWLLNIPKGLRDLLKGFNHYQDKSKTSPSIIFWDGIKDESLRDDEAHVTITKVTGMDMSAIDHNDLTSMRIELKNETGDSHVTLVMPQNRRFLDAVQHVLTALMRPQ